MQSTPYCQVAPNELASYPIPSLDECQDLCDSYQACVAVVYDSSFGCRIHFYSYSDAADAGDDLGLTGFGCIQGGATGDITQTNGSGAWECLVKDSCGSDGKSGSIFKNHIRDEFCERKKQINVTYKKSRNRARKIII